MFADFLVHHLPIGLVGIVLGAVFSAAMSTLSSSLSASAGALVNDFLLPATGHSPDSPFALRAAKLATVLFAGGYLAMAGTIVMISAQANSTVAIRRPESVVGATITAAASVPMSAAIPR